MAVYGISSANTNPAGASYLPGSERIPSKTLGQAEFFKLIAVQFASQDPLKPMEDTAFIAQLANFTALENSAQLTREFGRFATQQEIVGAQGLLGRTVTVSDTNDTEVQGVVSAVYHDGETSFITVNGDDYDVASVRRVELTSNPIAAE